MSLTLVFWTNFIWGQIAIQFLTSTALVILLGWFQPLDSTFANRMELLNELTTMCILYMVMCFSDFVGDPATRHMCGFIFIGVLGTFLAIHVYFIAVSIYKALRHLIRDRYYKKKRQAAYRAIMMR